RRTQMVANGQQPMLYQYDAASRLTRVEQGALFAALGYDNANRRTSLSYSNNTTTSYAYDLASRLTGITHNGPSGVIEALAYIYDAAGNRLNLIRANRPASLLPNAITSATYDAANQQTTFAGAALTYDANGNLTNDGVNTYQWDARNRLVGISGVMTAQFNYDGLGRRTQKTISNQSAALITGFLYDGIDIASEIGSGTVGASYLHGLQIDELFIRQSAAGNEHYHADPLGSSLALSNEQGASSTSYAYEPFGKTTISGDSTNPFQYTGRENEEEGLYNYRLRYYSTIYHRFIQEDRLGFLGSGVNYYAYVINSPTRWIDPMGWAYVGPTINHSSVSVAQASHGNRTLGFSVQGGQGLQSVNVRVGVGQAPARGQGGLGPFKVNTNSQIEIRVPLGPGGTGSGTANISTLLGGGQTYLQIQIVHPGSPTAHLTNFPNDLKGGQYPIGLCGGNGAPSCDVLRGYGGPDASGYVEPGTSPKSKSQE
ncbi:MAG: RHS repeat-associated core domain-containing protein, partial [Nitrospira sp.]|nr:RHS repeat-associated core domain-containing protein [Nitrospira sp.]